MSEEFLSRLRSEHERIKEELPKLQAQHDSVADELAKAEVILRHLSRNPERFSPPERESVYQRLQNLAMRRQELATAIEALGEKAALIDEVIAQSLIPIEAPPTSALEVYQAVEAERLRIARDLHDGPAQSLSNLVLEVEILERLLRRDPNLLAPEFQEFKNALRNCVADIRRLIFDMRPISLDDLGLVATMQRIATEYQDRTGVVCRFNLTGEDRRLPPDVEEALYWIIQEGLTNVNRHSRAKLVEIGLDIQPTKAWLRIKDDGQGFDAAAPPEAKGGRRHLGLIGMKERAATLRGTVQIASQPGQGSQIVAEFALVPAGGA